MKEIILAGVVAFCGLSHASDEIKDAVHLTFNGADGEIEDYFIPNQFDDARTTLIYLSSPMVESVCFSGQADRVLQQIDLLVSAASSTVKLYKRSENDGLISLTLDVVNFRKKLQKSDMEISSCD